MNAALSANGTTPSPDVRPDPRDIARKLATLGRALLGASDRRVIGLLVAGVIAVIALNTAGQIRLNTWHGAFYDAIGARELGVFVDQLLVFGALAGFLLVTVVAQTWLVAMLKVRLRQWLTHDLLDLWLEPCRPYRLSLAGEIGEHPDQRLQDDIRHLADLSADLAAGLLQATFLLVSFVGVLWSLSREVPPPFVPADTTLPGYLVWCAVAYALAGSYLTWRVGRPLVALNVERYGREAAFRFALVRISERAEAIALYRGEPDERRGLDGSFVPLLGIMTRLANGLARLTWITSGYGWIAIVLPIMLAAPGYFSGGLSLGGMMMVVNAFYQVQQSLRWFVDNFAVIADWHATLARVTVFRDALQVVDRMVPEAGRIAVVERQEPSLVFSALRVLHPEGCARLDADTVRIEAGERVLVVGEAGSGKSVLFRAMAGLWPWGSGTILTPPRAMMMFLPQRPYLPLGTLRAALAYPATANAFTDEAIRAALDRVGLVWLAASLDAARRWDRDLSLERQQRLAFARLLLHRPGWVVLDEATSALPDEQLQLMESILSRELAGSTVIGLARRDQRNGFYRRIVHLGAAPERARLDLRALTEVRPLDPATNAMASV